MDDSSLSPRDTSQIGRRVMSSAMLLWALSMFVRGLQLLSMAVLARLLVPADFGLVAIATTVMMLLDVITNFQLGSTIVRSDKVTPSHLNTAFTLSLLRGASLAIILAVAAHPLALFMDQPKLENVLYALTLSPLIGSAANPYFVLYMRDLNFKMEARRQSTAAICANGTAIISALLFRSYWALIAVPIIQGAVNCMLTYWRTPGRPRLSLEHAREMLSFGVWLVAQGFIMQLALRLDYFYIGKLLDTKVLGGYHLGNQINSMATADVMPSIERAIYPAFAMISDDPDRVGRSYIKMQSIALIIALPIGAGLALLAEPLILFLFGPGWHVAQMVVQFMSPITAFQMVSAGVDALAMARNRMRALAHRAFVYAVVRTVLQIGGFLVGGLLGLMIGRAISGIFQALYGLALGAQMSGHGLLQPLVASWRTFAGLGAMAVGLLLLPAPDYKTLSWAMLAVQLVMRAATGAAIFSVVDLSLWRISGRPDGAERFILDHASRYIAKYVRR